MDDFLHNLRSGKLKQGDQNRRNFNDYKNSQRRVTNERRKTDYYAKVTNENFSMIKQTLDTLADYQKRMADAVAERNKTQSRIADALETIVRLMDREPEEAQAQSTVQAEMPERIQSEEKWDAAPGMDGKSEQGNGEKEAENAELIDIISTMRNQGNSWEKIARHFDEQQIPTVSGKGKWRGPAIKKIWTAHA